MAPAKATPPAEPTAPTLTPAQQAMADAQAKGDVAAYQLAQLARLREPFSPNQISLLPKPVKKTETGDPKGECKEGTPGARVASKDGKYCGGYHVWSIHLDYVGHAAITDRLLEVDPFWEWEPVAYTAAGEPLVTNLGMWIKLTIAGTTKLGFGDAQGKTGSNAIKEIIGDALRNAGMRFGMALDLWHKGDLHDAAAEQGLVAKDEPTPEAKVEDAQPLETTDWLAKAKLETTSDGVINVWREAKFKMTRAQMPTAEIDKNLKPIVDFGQTLKDAEDAKKIQDAVEEPTAQMDEATASVAGAFSGPPDDQPV